MLVIVVVVVIPFVLNSICFHFSVPLCSFVPFFVFVHVVCVLRFRQTRKTIITTTTMGNRWEGERGEKREERSERERECKRR